nr:antitoxin Xre/MbcA/ParS toxin-binding domain-containing protein [Gloeobacter violaceus]
MKLPMTDLAKIVHLHRNTLSRRPQSPEVQSRLGRVAKIIARAAAMIGGEANRAVIWFRFEPLPGFDHKTAAQLVAEGHADAVETYLDMLDDGVYA